MISNFKFFRKVLIFIVAAGIFFAAALELLSWFLSFGEPATITDVGNNYLIKWYPLLSSLTIWIFAFVCFSYIMLFDVCIYSKIVGTIYLLIQCINVSAYIFQFGYITYNEYIYPVFLFTILGLTLIKIIKWLSKSLFLSSFK